MKQKLLIIDDDMEATRLLSAYLGQFGYELLAAGTPDEGQLILAAQAPALVLLDVMLPHRSGFDLCREIRNVSAVPILMLTARGQVGDRVLGLECGADDYLPKPYEPRELLLRIQSILRRVQVNAQSTKDQIKTLASGELILDLVRASAWLGGKDMALTASEFEVLKFLMERAGQTVSRNDIHMLVKGEEWDVADRSVDMIVSRLRNKLRHNKKDVTYLKTMWGDGYRFIGEVSSA